MITSRNSFLILGLLALLIAAFSAYDATRMRPTDGAQWLLGGDEIRIVGLTRNGPAERAGLEFGDVIEGIGGSPVRSPRHAAGLVQSHAVGDSIRYLIRHEGHEREVQTYTIGLDSTRITNVSTYLIYCAMGLIFFIAGSYVFWGNDRQAPARIFFVLCLSFLVYFFSGSEKSSIYYWSDLFVWNFGTLASLLVPPLFLHFFLVFPQRQRFIKKRRWLIPLIYVLPILYYLDFSYSQFRGNSVASISAVQQLTLGFYFSGALTSLISTYFSSPDSNLRQRVKILTLGTVLGTLPFLIFNIAMGKLLGNNDYALLGAIPMVLVPMSFSYSIARYRLMEIEVIIRRSLVYAALTGITVGAYLVLVVIVGNAVLNLSGQRSQLVAIISTLLIAAAFQPARERIQAFIERSFFREKHNLQQALQELARDLPKTLGKEALESLVRERITALLHPKRFAYLTVENHGLSLPTVVGVMPLPALTIALRRRNGVLAPDDMIAELSRLARRGDDDSDEMLLAFERELDLLRREDLELVVAAIAGERIVGGFALGAKRSEAAFDGAETEMLQIIAGQLGTQIENSSLVEEVVARQRLEEELAMARSIQQRMLPAELPHLEGFEVAAMNKASAQVSGDYYDFLTLADGRTGIVISDVAGKGMPASLLASNLQASIRAVGATRSNPGDILTVVNGTLFDSTDPDRFATTFMIRVDGHRILYSNGGHNPPLLRRSDGSVEWLDVGATPLGAFPAIVYPEATVDLAMGDLLVMFTDGVTESTNLADEFFGEAGLEAVIHSAAHCGAQELLDTIHGVVMEHSGGIATDDMTMVVLRRTS
jgi:sigma-B regulation protein RsbU (phosphoserine phosphatase)